MYNNLSLLIQPENQNPLSNLRDMSNLLFLMTFGAPQIALLKMREEDGRILKMKQILKEYLNYAKIRRNLPRRETGTGNKQAMISRTLTQNGQYSRPCQSASEEAYLI